MLDAVQWLRIVLLAGELVHDSLCAWQAACGNLCSYICLDKPHNIHSHNPVSHGSLRSLTLGTSNSCAQGHFLPVTKINRAAQVEASISLVPRPAHANYRRRPGMKLGQV